MHFINRYVYYPHLINEVIAAQHKYWDSYRFDMMMDTDGHLLILTHIQGVWRVQKDNQAFDIDSKMEIPATWQPFLWSMKNHYCCIQDGQLLELVDSPEFHLSKIKSLPILAQQGIYCINRQEAALYFIPLQSLDINQSIQSQLKLLGVRVL